MDYCMISVTRFNHTELYINADLVEFVECTPDTVITMVTGRKVLVLEKPEEIRQRIAAYRRETGPIALKQNSLVPGEGHEAAWQHTE